MKTLVLLPARGGSRGIPHKNIRLLGGKPLIGYAIETARQVADDEDICLSTDDEAIARMAERYGLKVPFLRPAELATDTAGTYDVILHALDHYRRRGMEYDTLILLQPTSPFRRAEDVRRCMARYERGDCEMVVSVRQAAANPYYDCVEPDRAGYLHPSKGDGHYTRRQELPPVYQYNGAVYVMQVAALRERSYTAFQRVGFVEMDPLRSLDLDTPLDWRMAELLLDEPFIQEP